MGNIATHHILKLNQSPYTIQSPSSLPSPNDLFNQILKQLNEWLAFLPNLFHSLIAKSGEAFAPETRAHWLAVATPHANEALGIVLLCLVCWFCLPVIISCIALLAAACWSLITGFFGLLWGIITGFFGLLWGMCRGFFGLLQGMCRGFFRLLWGMCRGFFDMCRRCGRSSLKMMKAPGRGGRVTMPRASFECNPGSYFRNLRAGKSAGNSKAESIGMAGAAVAGVAMLAWGVSKLFGT